MSKATFSFKEFSLSQDKSAMKVGTDGVLLGAWTQISENVGSILDIGTGTGLIALQLAQRCDSEIIDALEIEPSAFEQAVENFESSPWSDRLFCYHASLQEFHLEIDDKYDLIVCNPPFYNNSYRAQGEQRNLARQSEMLGFEELLLGVAALLNPQGTCAFIVPHDQEQILTDLGSKQGLHAYRITRVKGSPERPVKRSLIQMQRQKAGIEISNLTIETSRHNYTQDYIDLVKDFYLKM
jgi:tRNA1Val (adenine37-N6)-methyltransferase